MNYTTRLLDQLSKVLKDKTGFPIGTLVYFGPDDTTITKIIAVVVTNRGSEPFLKSWEGPGISLDPETVTQIGQFFKQHRVVEVVMTDRVVGCPHEEGKDYPIGGECPHCPYWWEAGS